MPISSVAKRATTTTFVVEHTNYGWPVGAGAERVGLFVTQRQALDDVKSAALNLRRRGNEARSL
jgi:hypothetical protein